MNPILHFKFSALTHKNAAAQKEQRQIFGKIALFCGLCWLLCMSLNAPDWVENSFSQTANLFIVLLVTQWITPSLKERARWGGITLDSREISINTLSGPKQKIPLNHIQSWKIQHQCLIISWRNYEDRFIKNKISVIPFQDLEEPEKFLSEFEKFVATSKK